MVAGYIGRYTAQIKKIEKILRDAKVPKKWYCIYKPAECRISIVEEPDGIHVFVPERGDRTGERIFTDWYKAIKVIADTFELHFTRVVIDMAYQESIVEQREANAQVPVVRHVSSDSYMNKSELIAVLAAKAGITKKDAQAALNNLFDVITESLARGEKVRLTGFGTFEAKERPARVARNPRTGEKVNIQARKTPSFKAGKALKDSVNIAAAKKSKK